MDERRRNGSGRIDERPHRPRARLARTSLLVLIAVAWAVGACGGSASKQFDDDAVPPIPTNTNHKTTTTPPYPRIHLTTPDYVQTTTQPLRPGLDIEMFPENVRNIVQDIRDWGLPVTIQGVNSVAGPGVAYSLVLKTPGQNLVALEFFDDESELQVFLDSLTHSDVINAYDRISSCDKLLMHTIGATQDTTADSIENITMIRTALGKRGRCRSVR